MYLQSFVKWKSTFYTVTGLTVFCHLFWIQTVSVTLCYINILYPKNCSRMIMSPVHQGLAKTILQGTVRGVGGRGRRRKRWEDNIREWTGLEFGKSQRAVENREKWRKLVAKSSVVFQRPSRLRD